MIQRFHTQPDTPVGFLNIKSGSMVFSRKQAATSEFIDDRRCVSARNVYGIMYSALVFPRYCYTMGRILAADTKCAWHILRPDVFKPNETNSGYCVTGLKLRTKWRRQLSLNYRWIDAKIHKQATTDQTVYVRYLHYFG
jgi:hypothetical protein